MVLGFCTASISFIHIIAQKTFWQGFAFWLKVDGWTYIKQNTKYWDNTLVCTSPDHTACITRQIVTKHHTKSFQWMLDRLIWRLTTFSLDRLIQFVFKNICEIYIYWEIKSKWQGVTASVSLIADVWSFSGHLTCALRNEFYSLWGPQCTLGQNGGSHGHI
jgi:hypothetical protein